MTSRISPAAAALSLFLIMLLSLTVRLVGLGTKSLWLDEAFSLWFSEQSWGYLWTVVPSYETHPPFYYSILKLWRSLMGSGEAALRLPSVLANVLTLPCLYLTGCIAGADSRGRWLGLLAAALAGGWYFQIHHAQEARPYALLTFASAFTLLCATWLVSNRDRLTRPIGRVLRDDGCAALSLLGLGTGLALQLWLHNMAALPVAVLALYLIAWWATGGNERPLLVALAIPAFLAFLLYAPNLSTLIAQTGAVRESFWLKAPNAMRLLDWLATVYGQRIWQLDPLSRLVIVSVTVATGTVGLARICRGHGGGGAAVFGLIVVMAFGPFALAVAVTYLATPVLLPRTLAHVQMPLVLILAALPAALPPRSRPAGVVIVLVLALAGALAHLGTVERQAAGADRQYAQVVQLIAASDAPRAPVLLVPNSLELPLGYYAERFGAGLELRPVPSRYPVLSEHQRYPSGNRGEPAPTAAVWSETIAGLEEFDTLWAVLRLPRLFDPAGLLDEALSRHFPCREEVLASVGFGPTLLRYSRREHCPPGR